MTRRYLGILVIAALAACSEISAPTPAVPVHDVLITATVPGRCIVGGCDPITTATTLGLIQILNTGTATAFLQACGTYVALSEQQLVNGHWVNVGPAVTCPFTPGPIALAAGDSIQLNSWFAAGTRRVSVGVASRSDMGDEALDSSASFDIK